MSTADSHGPTPPWTIRFDLRNPPFAGVPTHERYRACLDMAQWADEHGAGRIVLSEHHGSDDGYLPSATTLAAAIAARTGRARIMLNAIVASFHDPMNLAEELVVVDQISGGRLDVVLVNGYVADEFAMFGVPVRQRARRLEETVTTLRAAFTGESFIFRDRTVRLTPAACHPGGPPIILGGSSEAAARRAARLGDGFAPSSPELWEPYCDELTRQGRPLPGGPPSTSMRMVHVARDTEEGWRRVAPYALHEFNAYGRWIGGGGDVSVADFTSPEALDAAVTEAEQLRASGLYRCLTPEAYAAELVAEPDAPVLLNPMMGGTPPDVAWESLELFAAEVLPRLAQALVDGASSGDRIPSATAGGQA